MQIRRFFSATIVAVIAAGLLGIVAPSASALTSAEASFVSKINHERTSRGLHALTVASDLEASARNHSAKMAAAGQIFHNSNLDNEINNWFVLGENVGVGPDVDSLHQAFMNSPHHRENILYPSYNIIGVGVVKGSDGYLYVTEVFAGRHFGTHTTTTTVTRHVTVTHAAPAHTTATSAQATVTQVSHPAAHATGQMVDLLVRMAGLDASNVNPVTGAAAGS
jgi:hypothetical protein